MNDDDGGRRPTQYWTAPSAVSTWRTTPEPYEEPIQIPGRRTGHLIAIWAGIVLLVVAVPLLVTMVLNKDAGPQRTIVLPSSVDAYDRVTGAVADRVVAGMRQAAKSDPKTSDDTSLAEKAAIALYVRNHEAAQRLIFLGVSARTDPAIGDELRSRSPSQNVGDVFHDGDGVTSFTGKRDFETGSLGGVLRCGTGKVDTIPTSVCVWADHSTLGILLGQRISYEELVGIARDFRSAAEH